MGIYRLSVNVYEGQRLVGVIVWMAGLRFAC